MDSGKAQQRAIDEWHSYVKTKIYALEHRIVKNPKGPLAESLLRAMRDWDKYEIDKKIETCQQLITEYSLAFEVNNTPELFTAEDWKSYCFKHGYDYDPNDIYGLTNHCYDEARNDYIILICDLDYFSQVHFFAATDILGSVLSNDLIYRKIHPYLGVQDKQNLVLLNRDKNFKLVNALNLYLEEYISESEKRRTAVRNILQNPNDVESSEYLHSLLFSQFSEYFACELNYALKRALWTLNCKDDLAKANVILTKTKEIIRMLDIYIKQHDLPSVLPLKEEVLNTPLFSKIEHFYDDRHLLIDMNIILLDMEEEVFDHLSKAGITLSPGEENKFLQIANDLVALLDILPPIEAKKSK